MLSPLLFCKSSDYIVTGKKWEYNGKIHQLFTGIKKACDTVNREALYNILIEFGILTNLDR